MNETDRKIISNLEDELSHRGSQRATETLMKEDFCLANRIYPPLIDNDRITQYEVKLESKVCLCCTNYKNFGGFYYCFVNKVVKK